MFMSWVIREVGYEATSLNLFLSEPIKDFGSSTALGGGVAGGETSAFRTLALTPGPAPEQTLSSVAAAARSAGPCGLSGAGGCGGVTAALS